MRHLYLATATLFMFWSWFSNHAFYGFAQFSGKYLSCSHATLFLCNDVLRALGRMYATVFNRKRWLFFSIRPRRGTLASSDALSFSKYNIRDVRERLREGWEQRNKHVLTLSIIVCSRVWDFKRCFSMLHSKDSMNVSTRTSPVNCSLSVRLPRVLIGREGFLLALFYWISMLMEKKN